MWILFSRLYFTTNLVMYKTVMIFYLFKTFQMKNQSELVENTLMPVVSFINAQFGLHAASRPLYMRHAAAAVLCVKRRIICFCFCVTFV